MDSLNKKDVVQAVVIADNFNENFSPITNNMSIALLPLINVPIIDFVLESLNNSGIEEVFVYCSGYVNEIKEHIQLRIANKCTWSVSMSVKIVGSDGCRCMGDVLRDLYGKGLIKNYFILMNADVITNAQLVPVLEKHKFVTVVPETRIYHRFLILLNHGKNKLLIFPMLLELYTYYIRNQKKTSQFDKGLTMTVIFKQTSTDSQENRNLIVGMDKTSDRLLFHQRKNSQIKGNRINLPMEMFFTNPEVSIFNDLVDPQIAICSPAVLPLFADNFDFSTRDDFIRGLLINEEILASSIYVYFLPSEHYAAQIMNWKSYQTISNDIMTRWTYPLVPDMGICCLHQNYVFLRNFVYKNKNVHLARSAKLTENVVIQAKCSVSDETKICFSVIGKNCRIGRNCVLNNAFLFDNVTIGDNSVLDHCVIGDNVEIQKNSQIRNGTVVGSEITLPVNVELSKRLIDSSDYDNSNDTIEKALIRGDTDVSGLSDSEDNFDTKEDAGFVNNDYCSSAYTSSSEEGSYTSQSPLAEDGKIFLSEVVDSLARGYEEKSNPEFLILEINSSRYAYNMTLEEVNYYVTKAVFNLQQFKDPTVNVIKVFHELLQYFKPILKNYIRGDSAMCDCLRALEDICTDEEMFKTKISQIIHLLYEKDVLSEESILTWYEDLSYEASWLKNSLSKLVEWLQQPSEEDSDNSSE